MDFENQLVKETKILDSEMQTLVSENYNKFISATDTIRKMRSDFKKMEDEMENLVQNMGDITEFNEKINHTFKDKRQEITRLNGVNNLLKKLQFLFELPARLNEFIEVKQSYSKAVMYYCKARKTLEHYRQMPTFYNIDEDCLVIINKLKEKLYEKTDLLETSNEGLTESIHLLNQLGEPLDHLCDKFMKRIEKCLDHDLSYLQSNIDILLDASPTKLQIAMDILEFVDHGCNSFLSNLSASIQLFNLLFQHQNNQNLPSNNFYLNNKNYEFNIEIAKTNLNSLVKIYWMKYCDLVKKRFEVEVCLF
jgi:hypothetical protein